MQTVCFSYHKISILDHNFYAFYLNFSGLISVDYNSASNSVEGNLMHAICA